jgi:FkbM family methyltransferase
MTPPPVPPFGAFPPPASLRLVQHVVASPRLPTGLRARLRRRLKRVMPAGPFDVTVDGIRFRAAPADNKVDFDIIAKRRLDEAAERAFLIGRLRPGDTFVDIGANIGVYTLSMLRDGPPDVRAVAFEPHPGLSKRLLFNLAANGVADRAEVLADAVGPEEATTTLWSNASRNSGRSSLIPYEGERSVATEVRVRPLASLLSAAHPRIDAVKIDIEGFEDQALMPFFDTAPKTAWPHSIVIETLHRAVWRRDCLAELDSLGYEEVDRTEENALLARRSRSD